MREVIHLRDGREDGGHQVTRVVGKLLGVWLLIFFVGWGAQFWFLLAPLPKAKT